MKTEGIVIDYAPLDKTACDLHLALLKSLECCRPVSVNGKEEFLSVVNARLAGGRIEVDVWITGCADPVAPELITIPRELTC